MTAERWLPVVGFEDLYEVSDLGRVRSVTRTITIAGRWGEEQRTYKGKLRVPHKAPGQPYLRVVLSRHSEKTGRTVHSVVADAFLGPCPPGQECRHVNCDASDNRAVKLAYGTRSENRSDSRATGTLAVGERIAQHKVTEEQVIAFRAGSKAPLPVTARQLRRIKNRENWKHV